jgi:hypothetical protein
MITQGPPRSTRGLYARTAPLHARAQHSSRTLPSVIGRPPAPHEKMKLLMRQVHRNPSIRAEGVAGVRNAGAAHSGSTGSGAMNLYHFTDLWFLQNGGPILAEGRTQARLQGRLYLPRPAPRSSENSEIFTHAPYLRLRRRVVRALAKLKRAMADASVAVADRPSSGSRSSISTRPPAVCGSEISGCTRK